MLFVGAAHAVSSIGTTATLVTSDMLIRTISATTSSIYTIGKMLISDSKYVDLSSLEKLEKQLDLLETIKIYNLCIKEILDKNKEIIDNSETVKESIHSIVEVLNELNELLKKIETKVAEHKLKWFSYFRSLNFCAELEELTVKKNILDNRFDILQKIYTRFN
jgi:hypothetical protein